MNDAKSSPGEPQPGHYGVGYGEQGTPKTPEAPTALDAAKDAPAGLEPFDAALDPDTAARANGRGSPVVFTADDVTARPPDRTPTEGAPASEKAALLFERS